MRKTMFYVYVLLIFLPLVVGTEMVQGTQDGAVLRTFGGTKSNSWVADRILNVVEMFIPYSRSCDTREDLTEARKKKKHKLNKYVVPLIVGFLLIKSILLPIALKALAVLSGKAVVLSLMSLILAAIVGLKKVAQSSAGNSYDVNRYDLAPSKYRRQDTYEPPDDFGEEEPYRFYREHRRRK